MKKFSAKIFAVVLAAMLVFTITPYSVLAATKLNFSENTGINTDSYSFICYEGDDFIANVFDGVGSDKTITAVKGETISLILDAGENNTNSYKNIDFSQQSTGSYHYGSDNRYCFATDVIFSFGNDQISSAVSGFGATKNENGTWGNASTQKHIYTTFIIDTNDIEAGEYDLSLTFKYQMKKSNSTKKEYSGTINGFVLKISENGDKPVHSHTYDENVVAPTCTEKGYTEFVCNNSDGYGKVGDDIYKGNEVAALNHEYSQTAISNNNGTHKRACVRFADCGSYSSDEDCNYTYEIVTPATPTSTGLGRYTCTACQYSYDETIGTTVCTHPNTEIRDAKDATCSSVGYTGDTWCRVCNTKIATGKSIEKLSHSAGTATRENVVNATCKAAGSYNEVVRCTKCNEVISSTPKTIDKLAHTAGTATRENVVNANCKAAGSYNEVVRCTKCNEVISNTPKTIDKLAHTPGKTTQENIVNATCVTAGSYDEVTYCSVCNAVIKTEKVTNSVDADNHIGDTEVRNAADPTVTEYGYTGDTYCKACNKIVAKGEKIDKLAPEMIKGHNSVWTKESNAVLSFTSNASVDDFVKVLINGKELSADNYSVSSGSTIVNLKSSYLNTLSAGVYTIDIASLNGTASADFTIKAADVPTTEPTTEEPVTNETSTEPTKPAEEEPTTKPTTVPSTNKTTTVDDTTSSTTTTAKADKTEKATNKTVAEKNSSKTSPNTGANDYVLFVSLMCAFGGCVVMLVVVKKRKIVTDK